MVKINYKLLPIKAHFFFFMAALGPILHQLNVFGKQMGVSEVVIGGINSILPIMFLLAKPLFGVIVDYFQEQRKLVFIVLVCSMNVFYILMYFIPQPSVPVLGEYQIKKLQMGPDILCEDSEVSETSPCGERRQVICNWNCMNGSHGTQLVVLLFGSNQSNRTGDGPLWPCVIGPIYSTSLESNNICDLTCKLDENDSSTDCLYGSGIFWSFVLLMSIGTIAFNVANSVSDAICFDVLGDGAEMGYGKQRVWGTIGFGLTALLSGAAVDAWSSGSASKDYTPAFLLILIFGIFDFYCCSKLKLPPLPRSQNIFKDVGKLLKHKHISIFVCFCALAGIIDSFIIYFLFWYLEDLAATTGAVERMKLLEGLIIAAETLVGEVIFFMFSGKILQRVGYAHSLTLCFIAYAVRLGLISIIPNPWWFLAVELFMQGPTYALAYTTIVVYASAVSPPGTSATMQGIVAGMDDGFGYAVGSVLGGLLYKWVGGSTAFKIFALTALTCGIGHFVVYEVYLKNLTNMPSTKPIDTTYKAPIEAVKATIVAGEENELPELPHEEKD